MSPASSPTKGGALVGRILDGRYRVDAAVGEGGFATIYSGLHLTLGVRVAIKVLHLDGGEPDRTGVHRADVLEELLADFIDEARLVTRLRHDHIVRTLDQGIFHDQSEHGAEAVPYLVLEWCGEDSLKDRLRKTPGGKLPLAEAHAIIAAITDAMAHAHELGVVHRDLKPANVMLARGPLGEVTPRIIDFGVAKVFEADDAAQNLQTITRSTGKFTPAYAAPEQLAGTRTGPYTDVHAIGLLFYELVTGRAPFAEGLELRGIDPERPTPARVGVDVGAFETVIAKSVALRPADRYPDAGALRDALKQAAGETDLATARPITQAPPPETARSTETGSPTSHAPEHPRQRSNVLAIALVALLGAGTLFALTRHRTSEDPPPAKATPVPTELAASASPSAPPSLPSAVASTLPAPKSSAKKVVAAATSASEKPHAPSASITTELPKGVGGIVEKPPF